MKINRILLSIVLCISLTGCSQASVSNNAQASDTEVAKTADAADAVDTADVVNTVDAAIDNSLISDYNIFDVTSDNLHNGKWDDIISDTDKGQNHSPQLSWEPVEGASLYMVYMVDTSMEYWIHWKSYDIKETTLPEGWADRSDYVGPWPPAGGTHTYEIYVIALKNPIERMKGALNSENMKFESFIPAANTDADGNTGNILGAAHISGTFTH